MSSSGPTPPPSSRAASRVRRILSPFQTFFANEASSGLLLIFAALIAFVWANTPWGDSYFALKSLPIAIEIGPWRLEHALYWWINDALMAVFFLLVGLEIKRELLVGELSNPRTARLAVIAAVGGMLVPAALYAVFNYGTPNISGWGVPMATDIAFAIGVLALLGNRVPLSLKVLLTALAIVDDLGAVLVIAAFYTASLNMGALLLGGVVLLAAFALNALRVRHLGLYALLGVALWLCFLASGVHPTIAGVLLAFAVPIAREVTPPHDALVEAAQNGTSEEVTARLAHLERNLEELQSPLHRLEHGLHPWTAFLILPLFALFNAGVSVAGSAVNNITLGVAVGLLVGKPLGVLLTSWLAVRSGLASLPEGSSWLGMLGIGLLAGIGFTMALFVAGLAFPSDAQLSAAKLGVLSASVVAALLAVVVLRRASPAASAT
ncbi:NhaA family Na+:H+ antiporter [Deinobacterium chartae]|uniref:Na(+)/H(+) antiporter NhaA n=1 Tax=Deinobacterium chartae TaxID=521158 RepID=A0A841I1P1_9DEIO|nr:Na+/H+ antiporter NhaA [Deinobacterium chartae]MBB6099731.1 NhaA family Na+:H+ antiporter [Deinobacterium chartae]